MENKKTKKVEVKNTDELAAYIEQNIFPILSPKTAILLDGVMGVGKTQFVRLFCKKLGLPPGEVSSPTFAIIQEYPSKLGTVHHVDLYRIESAEELENTGFWEIFLKDKGIVFIEWPSKMDLSRIPKSWKILKVKLEFSDHPESRTCKMYHVPFGKR